MTASFEGNQGDDPVLSAHFPLIRDFTNTVVSLADQLQKVEQPVKSNEQEKSHQ